MQPSENCSLARLSGRACPAGLPRNHGVLGLGHGLVRAGGSTVRMDRQHGSAEWKALLLQHGHARDLVAPSADQACHRQASQSRGRGREGTERRATRQRERAAYAARDQTALQAAGRQQHGLESSRSHRDKASLGPHSAVGRSHRDPGAVARAPGAAVLACSRPVVVDGAGAPHSQPRADGPAR